VVAALAGIGGLYIAKALSLVSDDESDESWLTYQHEHCRLYWYISRPRPVLRDDGGDNFADATVVQIQGEEL